MVLDPKFGVGGLGFGVQGVGFRIAELATVLPSLNFEIGVRGIEVQGRSAAGYRLIVRCFSL